MQLHMLRQNAFRGNIANVSLKYGTHTPVQLARIAELTAKAVHYLR